MAMPASVGSGLTRQPIYPLYTPALSLRAMPVHWTGLTKRTRTRVEPSYWHFAFQGQLQHQALQQKSQIGCTAQAEAQNMVAHCRPTGLSRLERRMGLNTQLESKLKRSRDAGGCACVGDVSNPDPVLNIGSPCLQICLQKAFFTQQHNFFVHIQENCTQP
jgi:hypothetical protein